MDETTRAAWLARGYELAADGTLRLIGATIHEKGTRVMVAGSVYTGTIVGGDFCSGQDYLVAIDHTGDRYSYRAGRTSYAAAKLLTGAAAVESLEAMKAHAIEKRTGEYADAFDAAIERLAMSAEDADEQSRSGGFYRRYQQWTLATG